ncbi:MAG: hypothetical protein WHT29_11925, partial [Bacteroidales bacterium]
CQRFETTSAPAAILAVLTIHCSTPPHICAAHRTKLGLWLVLIFKAIKTPSPQSIFFLISTPISIPLNLDPFPQPSNPHPRPLSFSRRGVADRPG